MFSFMCFVFFCVKVFVEGVLVDFYFFEDCFEFFDFVGVYFVVGGSECN